MVGARDIPSVATFETVVADEDVLESDGEAVADVEVAVGVGGRHDDGIVFAGFLAVVGLEGVRGFPEGVDVGLELIGVVGFAELHGIMIARNGWLGELGDL